MATKFGSMVTYLGGLLAIKPNDLLVTGFARSCEKLKPLYFHYHSAYGHYTWQDGNLLWRTPTRKVTWPFHIVFLQDHVTNWNHYISTTTMSMTIKLCRVVSYYHELPPLNSRKPLITWSYKITSQTKTIISPLPECTWQLNLAGRWLILKIFYP